MEDINSLFEEAQSLVHFKHPREIPFEPFQLVALFTKTTCHSCGAQRDQFEGIFEERRRRGTTVMLRQPRPPANSSLPRVRKYLHHTAPYCELCCNLPSYEES